MNLQSEDLSSRAPHTPLSGARCASAGAPAPSTPALTPPHLPCATAASLPPGSPPSCPSPHLGWLSSCIVSAALTVHNKCLSHTFLLLHSLSAVRTQAVPASLTGLPPGRPGTYLTLRKYLLNELMSTRDRFVLHTPCFLLSASTLDSGLHSTRHNSPKATQSRERGRNGARV